MDRAGRRRASERLGRFLLDFWACFLIPAYTLLFAGGARWITTNFSALAADGPDRFFTCIGWGILLGAYFVVMLLKIGWTVRGRRTVCLLTLLACLALLLALVLPYLPERLPGIARLHVVLAFSACVLMMLVLLLVLLRCRRQDRRRYDPLLLAWAGIAAGSGGLFWMAGMVSSALEIFFAISAALLVRRLWLCRRAEERNGA